MTSRFQDLEELLTSETLKGFETYLKSETPLSLDIITESIQSLNGMLLDDYPMDTVKYVELLQLCKEIPDQTELKLRIEQSITLAQEVRKKNLRRRIYQIILKSISIFLKPPEDSWKFGEALMNIIGEFIIVCDGSAPDFWQWELWKGHSFSLQILTLKELAITEENTERKGKLESLAVQLEGWETKLTVNRLIN